MAFYQCIKLGGGTGDVADVEVNGISVVDPTTKIAKITSYEEVTESEYEAIPVAERESNGVAYFIKDLNNESVQGYPPLIYSLEEREIGVWADGKPLYQITFDYTASPITINTSWTKINSIDDIIPINGFAVKPDSSKAQFLIDIDVDSGDGTYVRAIKEQAVAKYITIQYIKESDTAGSGKWNGQGGIAHHYSTNETVIGTWIDGKPLYEKTFTTTLDNVPQTTPVNMADVSGLRIDEIANVSGRVNYYNGTDWLNVNLGTYFGIYIYPNGYLQFFQTITAQTTNRIYKVSVTLQYTKTTN